MFSRKQRAALIAASIPPETPNPSWRDASSTNHPCIAAGDFRRQSPPEVTDSNRPDATILQQVCRSCNKTTYIHYVMLVVL